MLQSVLRAIYPPRCIACGAQTESDYGLCADCWAQTQFLSGLVCDQCGAGLPGTEDGGARVLCDDCLQVERPWAQGRAVFHYEGNGRQMVLQLKHGDRTDLARPLGAWMARVAGPLLREDTVIVPVPLHWLRLLRRRYNQAALLAHRIGDVAGRPVLPDALTRPRATRSLEGQGRSARQALLQEAIAVHPRRAAGLKGKSVLMVDDVMTSGATLTACARAALDAGAREVCVLALARAGKSP